LDSFYLKHHSDLDKKQQRVKVATFEEFYDRFPEIELPISLGEDEHMLFSAQNLPLSQSMLEEFVFPFDKAQRDEYTEYVPCFRLPKQDQFVGVIYWRAQLMDYHYMLSTFDLSGKHISASHIAGMRTDGQSIARLVARISDKLEIRLMVGKQSIDDNVYEASTSQSFNITMDETGHFEIEMNEDWI